MRKPITIFLVILTIIISIWIQVNIINMFPLFGVSANIGIILVCGLGLISGKVPGTIIGATYGLLSDIIFGKAIGIYTVIYILIGFICGYMSKGFAKENKMSMVMMVFLITIFFELCAYIMSLIIFNYEFLIWSTTSIIIKEAIYNVILTLIIFKLILNLGEMINKIKKSYYLL